jgi:hypothetical protein
MPTKIISKFPETEFILIFLAGIFVIGGSIIGPVTNLNFGGIAMLSQYFEYFGIVVGVLLIMSAIVISMAGIRGRKAWGMAALIFSFLSLPAGGGMLAGFILGLIGSIFTLRG